MDAGWGMTYGACKTPASVRSDGIPRISRAGRSIRLMWSISDMS